MAKAIIHFDLVDLNLFRQVVEAGSITRGAARAHLALAAASTRIRNMEEALGAALLVRQRQGVTPTQAAHFVRMRASYYDRLSDCARISVPMAADLPAKFVCSPTRTP